MIGNAFLKRLMFKLDFLNEDDRQVVMEFYQKKLSKASTLTEEEAIVKTFGSPEYIAEKLKETYNNYLASVEKRAAEGQSKSTSTSTENNDAPCETASVNEEAKIVDKTTSDEAKDTSIDTAVAKEDTLPENENSLDPYPENTISSSTDEISIIDQEDQTDDVIFSKPANEEKAPEIIHSLENNESVTLYGEKVVIENRKTPVEEIPLETADTENGLTPEEIELAKAETLEKTENYHTANIVMEETTEEARSKSDPAPQVESSPVESSMDSFEADVEDTEEEQAVYVDGIFDKMFSSPSISKGTLTFLKILLSLIISPIILLIFGGIVLIYSVTTLLIVLLGAILFALMVSLIIAGVVELIYGFAMLFDTVSVALIEIGLGTVLFALVTAVAALIYEFLFGVLPRTLKKLTQLCKKFLKKSSLYLYGGKA